tara:strand:+ start:278 stop:481 length:204 start_codon:yes stop_codon:yes gene_type:complete
MRGDIEMMNMGEFEQASERVLLEIALEASGRELAQLAQTESHTVKVLAAPRKMPTLRSPVLHQVDAG